MATSTRIDEFLLLGIPALFVGNLLLNGGDLFIIGISPESTSKKLEQAARRG